MARSSAKRYRDFVLKIGRSESGDFRAEASGPAGEAENSFTLPFDEKDLKVFLFTVQQHRRNPQRGYIPDPLKETVEFGSRLYNAVFSGEVGKLFIRSREKVGRLGVGLRLRLRLQPASMLADVPWEFLYDGEYFLALSPDLPIVHYMDLPRSPDPLKVQLPVRILVTISLPTDGTFPKLEVDKERRLIEEALRELDRER